MKRKRETHECHRARKEAKRDTRSPLSRPPDESLLNLYYARVQSLRDYLLARLSSASKRRRRRIAQYGAGTQAIGDDGRLAELLDRTLIGSFNTAKHTTSISLQQDLTMFSQQLDDSTASTVLSQGLVSLSEVSLGLAKVGVLLSPTIDSSCVNEYSPKRFDKCRLWTSRSGRYSRGTAKLISRRTCSAMVSCDLLRADRMGWT